MVWKIFSTKHKSCNRQSSTVSEVVCIAEKNRELAKGSPPSEKAVKTRRLLKKMQAFPSIFPKLLTYFAQRSSFQGIPRSTVFAPTSITEPSPTVRPLLSSSWSLLSAPVTDILESKIAEIAPSSRKHMFLREIGYVGCTAENIAYLCKKDSPVLLPFEIRARHDILFVATVHFEYKKLDENTHDIFLVIVTKHEINFYEARPIEQEEVDFLSSFSVACPHDCTLTCVRTVGSLEKHVYFGSDKGYVFELRMEGRQTSPTLVCLNDEYIDQSKIHSLHSEDTKGLLYALHEDSTIEVFMQRINVSPEAARKVAEYTPKEKKLDLIELFPLPSEDDNKAYLLGVSEDCYLYNFELDLRQSRNCFHLFQRFLHLGSTRNELHLTSEESCLATKIHSDGVNRKIISVGYFGGLVLAVPVIVDGNHCIELWTASRLPPYEMIDGVIPTDAVSVALIKEPIQIDGPTVSIQSASEDDNTKLFDGLDLGSDDLSQQVFLKSKKLTILAGSKVIDVRKKSPVESLLEILHVQFPERLDEFFDLYGPLETAIMAVQLAAARGEERAFQLLLEDSRLSTMLFASEGHTRDDMSIPTQAILTYFRRLISPLWTKPLLKLKKDSANKKEEIKMSSNVSMMLLEWFESSLQEFSSFLERFIDHHQGIRFYDGTVFAPKCPTVLSEFQLLFELKDLVNKCKEMIQLIQIFEEYKPLGLNPELMKILNKTSFGTLSLMTGGEKSPLQELMKTILQDKESEIQEAIVFRMDNEIPGLARRKNKVFKKALNLLLKAKSSPRPERQEKMVQKAMTLLSDNSEEEQIDDIVATLTDLQRHYEVLQFVSKTAKKLVPELPTHDPDVQKKALHLRQRCYGRAFNYVDNYIKNIDSDEASTDIPVLFKAVQCLADSHMMTMMLEKLLISNKIPRDALHHPSFLEFGTALRKHLTKKLMNLSTSIRNPASEEVCLSEASVREMRLLVEICQSHGDFKMAGDWLMIIAKRLPEKDQKIPLIERIGDMNDARAMYDSAMPDAFLRSIENDIEIGMFQHRMLTLGKKIFAIMDDRLENGEDVKEVLNKLAPPDVLFRVIQENFPPQIAQDLSDELTKINKTGPHVFELDSAAFQIMTP